VIPFVLQRLVAQPEDVESRPEVASGLLPGLRFQDPGIAGIVFTYEKISSRSTQTSILGDSQEVFYTPVILLSRRERTYYFATRDPPVLVLIPEGKIAVFWNLPMPSKR
jgi:hypothetical protein